MKNTRRLALIVSIMSSLFLIMGEDRAAAGFWQDIYSGYEQFTNLPEEVNKLKESYEQTITELNNAKTSIESFQERNEELLAQNEYLKEQNETLTTMVSELQKAEEQRKRTHKRIMVTLITAVSLVIFYFVLIRIIRYRMRRHSHR